VSSTSRYNRDRGPTVATDDIDVRLSQIEVQLERLRTLYEQHFAGVLKRIPMREHELLRSALRSILPHELKSTAMRFKHQTIKTRHIQMSNLWDKTLREIEGGTYKRDLFLLRAKTAESEPPTAQSPPPEKRPSGITNQLEMLYKKYSEIAAAQKQKIPEKAAFLKTIQAQIETQKEKNPKAKIELKLQKDETGKFQVKVSGQ